MTPPRPLTIEERRILGMIQDHYGAQNSEDSICWVGDDEATVWVTNFRGEILLMVHLTNIAAWRLEGWIESDDDLRRDYLRILD